MRFAIVGAGAIGALELISDAPRKATVVATEEGTELFTLGLRQFRRLQLEFSRRTMAGITSCGCFRNPVRRYHWHCCPRVVPGCR